MTRDNCWLPKLEFWDDYDNDYPKYQGALYEIFQNDFINLHARTLGTTINETVPAAKDCLSCHQPLYWYQRQRSCLFWACSPLYKLISGTLICTTICPAA